MGDGQRSAGVAMQCSAVRFAARFFFLFTCSPVRRFVTSSLFGAVNKNSLPDYPQKK